MQPTDELYYKYAGVIDSVVHYYSRKCPDLADELFLQAQYVFCTACLSYDPNHAKGASFETWLRRQLQSITHVITKASKGPSTVEDVTKSAVTWSVLEESRNNHHNDDLEALEDLADVASQEYVKEYGANLENEENLGYPPEMIPYIKALTGDALQIFNDYCQGKFELGVPFNMPLERQKAREVLNPNRLHRRLYSKEGWSLDRVRTAWLNLTNVFNNYRTGKIPAMVNLVKASNTTKSSGWLDRFKEKHNMPYSAYRNKVKRGLLPIPDGSNEQVELFARA